MLFSDSLVSETKEYFKKRYGRKLSDIQANLYLESLAAMGSIAFELLSPASTPTPSKITGDTTGSAAPGVSPDIDGRRLGGTELVSQYPITPMDDD